MPIKFHPVVRNPEWEREDLLISSDSLSRGTVPKELQSLTHSESRDAEISELRR